MYWGEYNATKAALERFSCTLPILVGYEEWRFQAPFLDVELFAIHTIVQVSTIHLQRKPFELETCQAMNTILSLIRQLSDADYEYLDPVMSVSTSSVSRP